MKTLIERLLEAGHKYTVMDFGCLKITLFFCGILVGTYFSNYFLNHTLFLWIVFILSYLWIMYRTFFKHMQ